MMQFNVLCANLLGSCVCVLLCCVALLLKVEVLVGCDDIQIVHQSEFERGQTLGVLHSSCVVGLCGYKVRACSNLFAVCNTCVFGSLCEHSV